MKKSNSNPQSGEDDLNIGDWVVEPTIGICQIQGIRSLKVGSVEDDFFVFYATNNTNVLVPRSQLTRRGVRRPMTLEMEIAGCKCCQSHRACKRRFFRNFQSIGRRVFNGVESN